MKTTLCAILCCLAVALFADNSPFGATATVTPVGEALELRVLLKGPSGGHFNAELLRLVLPDGYAAEAVELPPPEADELFEEGVYSPGTVLRYRITPPSPLPAMRLRIQGCVDEMCYMPQTIELAPTATAAQQDRQGPPSRVSTGWYEGFAREQVRFGYANAEEFASWLDAARGASPPSRNDNLLVRMASRHGLWLAVLLVIPLGLLLNLTPCVLPMLPVTLAVLGAKSAGAGRRRGAALGAAYGGAMALAYGVVGALFVKVGGRFGGVNANPWFNWGVGIVFVCLSLSMFDIFLLDLTRFRGSAVRPGRGFGTAVLLGATAALLAGACVAPVLIWVLFFSAALYGGGNSLGLWLPFLLGVGLGLPWPFLGGGLGVLPRPGAWMVRVKQFFGVLILLFACYYFWNGAKLLWTPKAAPVDDGYWKTDAAAAAAEARELGRPLFIDFWGVTCKACDTMDATTLRNPEVLRRLDQMTRLKIQADDFDAPALAPVLEHFNIPGLPAYVVLVP